MNDRFRRLIPVERLPRLGVLTQALLEDRHQVAVAGEAIDQRGGHHFVAEDFAQSSKLLFDM